MKYYLVKEGLIDLKKEPSVTELENLILALAKWGMSIIMTYAEAQAAKIIKIVYDMFGDNKKRPECGYYKHISNELKRSYQNEEKNFLKCKGISIQKLIIKTKITIAIELLQKGELPIKDIAIYLHYYDDSHFSRQLLLLTGHRPGYYSIKH